MAYEPSNAAKQKAARFLALALEARERGNNGLAEMLTEAANSVLEDAATVPPPAQEPQQPVAQQQQQIQPDKKENE
jgi:hypothetical protein